MHMYMYVCPYYLSVLLTCMHVSMCMYAHTHMRAYHKHALTQRRKLVFHICAIYAYVFYVFMHVHTHMRAFHKHPRTEKDKLIFTFVCTILRAVSVPHMCMYFMLVCMCKHAYMPVYYKHKFKDTDTHTRIHSYIYPYKPTKTHTHTHTHTVTHTHTHIHTHTHTLSLTFALTHMYITR
jgi:hypothetical protein